MKFLSAIILELNFLALRAFSSISHSSTHNNLETKIHTEEKCASVWSSWWFFVSLVDKIQLICWAKHYVCAPSRLRVWLYTYILVLRYLAVVSKPKIMTLSLRVSYNLKFCFLLLSLWERKKRCRRFLSKNVSKPWIRGEAEIWLCSREIESFLCSLDAPASNYLYINIKLHLPAPIMIDPLQTRCYYVGTDRTHHQKSLHREFPQMLRKRGHLGNTRASKISALAPKYLSFFWYKYFRQ